LDWSVRVPRLCFVRILFQRGWLRQHRGVIMGYGLVFSLRVKSDDPTPKCYARGRQCGYHVFLLIRFLLIGRQLLSRGDPRRRRMGGSERSRLADLLANGMPISNVLGGGPKNSLHMSGWLVVPDHYAWSKETRKIENCHRVWPGHEGNRGRADIDLLR
jgi:hypothetical protein